MIVDNYGRTINYLRLAITDRCNLRCGYCMPEEGLNWLSRKELMTNSEIIRICSLLVTMGIEKVRITGGEPFARKDIMPLLKSVSQIHGLEQLTLTTNGVLMAPFIPELKKIGIDAVNLSLDTLDRDRFIKITHRDDLNKVLASLDTLLKYGLEVKINAVVMEDLNIADLIPLVYLTKKYPVSVRFIEQMPFNGSGLPAILNWDFIRILEHIKAQFPAIKKVTDSPQSTAYNYHIPGHKGSIGIIAAYSRTFCGTCNRIRITPTGMLKTCLYDQGGLNIKEAIRASSTDEQLAHLITESVFKKSKDGWAADQAGGSQDHIHESMATIGG